MALYSEKKERKEKSERERERQNGAHRHMTASGVSVWFLDKCFHFFSSLTEAIKAPSGQSIVQTVQQIRCELIIAFADISTASRSKTNNNGNNV